MKPKLIYTKQYRQKNRRSIDSLYMRLLIRLFSKLRMTMNTKRCKLSQETQSPAASELKLMITNAFTKHSKLISLFYFLFLFICLIPTQSYAHRIGLQKWCIHYTQIHQECLYDSKDLCKSKIQQNKKQKSFLKNVKWQANELIENKQGQNKEAQNKEESFCFENDSTYQQDNYQQNKPESF